MVTRRRPKDPTPIHIVRMARSAEDDVKKKIKPARLAAEVLIFIQNVLARDPTEYGDYGLRLYGSRFERKGFRYYVARQRKFKILYRIPDDGVPTIEVLRVYLA